MRAALLIPFVLVGCEQADEHRPPPPKPAPVPLNDHAALLGPIQSASLTVMPIVATVTPDDDVDVVTLDEAFAQKLVSIKEQPSETVNSLTLTNKANRPLFLLAGEVVIGGKQDRIIGQNTIIAASTTQAVPVFCVEAHRWNGQTTEFASANALAHGRLRGHASFDSQQAVWAEVNHKNLERGTMSETDTYRHVAKQQTKIDDREIMTAVAHLDPMDRIRMIGYAVALDGKVATVDMFSSPKLFRKLEEKLVRSYLTEAVDTPATGAKPPTVADVKTFMADADKAKEQPSYGTSEAATTRYDGVKAAKARVEMLKSAKKGFAAKKAAPVYEMYQLKSK
jgi:hypothetical protein